MSILFNQWDVVLFTSGSVSHKQWKGLVIDADRQRILWDNGNITESFGPSILLNTTKIVGIFDVEKAYDAAKTIGKGYTSALDNLTFLEIFVGYRKHLNEYERTA